MLNRQDKEAILDRIRANRERLDACPGPHDFASPDRTPGGPFDRKYVCKKCGGEVDTLAFYWYGQGLQHGEGQCNPGNAQPAADGRGHSPPPASESSTSGRSPS